MTKDQIFEFFRRLAEDNPEPETELEYGNAYQLVVAVALSAQATDVGVNKATRALFREVKTPQQMLELGEDGLKEHIKTIGLFNSKAKNVIALSQLLVDEYGGEVPDSREELVKLPGVGRKTANVVLNCWFKQEPSRSIRISFASETARVSPRGRRPSRSRPSSRSAFRNPSASMRTTG